MTGSQIKELYANLDQLIAKKVLQSKNIIAFGANKPTEKTILYLKARGFSVAGIIDNDRSKIGKKMLGIDIFSPESLRKRYDNNVAVLIASQYYQSMSLQLQSYGYKEGRDIFQTIMYFNCNILQDCFNQKVSDLKKGSFVYQRITEKYGNDCSIIICPYQGMGDIYFISSYLEAYLQKNHIKKYVLTVIGTTGRRIANMFGIENIEVLSVDDLDCLIDFYRMLDEKGNNIKVLSHNYLHTDILANFERNNRLSWGVMLKQCIMNLSENEPKREPKWPENPENVEKLFQEKGLVKGKTVILSPYANTLARLDDGFWKEVADYYNSKGYVVCTNSMGKEEPPVKGSKAIEFSLEDARLVVEYAGTFIGLRSGLCDVINGAKAKKYIIYPTKESLFFNMADMGMGKDVKELVLDDRKSLLRKICYIERL
ncbi:MAG: ADP-heptose:LPS heptosyltransferase [Lachnoclostridium sp.]